MVVGKKEEEEGRRYWIIRENRIINEHVLM